MQHHIQEITINGLLREAESVVVHSGYKEPPEKLVKEALVSGDGSKLRGFLASSDDIALIKLKAPVTDVKPTSLYRGSDEIGRTVQLIGKGATGNGSEGVEPHGPHRTTLRRAFNVISSVIRAGFPTRLIRQNLPFHSRAWGVMAIAEAPSLSGKESNGSLLALLLGIPANEIYARIAVRFTVMVETTFVFLII